mgnify:CR=1 FL=1
MAEPDPDVLTMVVEIPTGSRNKYEVDHHSGEIFLDRRLFTATRYPTDYGYVPGTLAEDDDPLDAMALVAEPTFPGCRIRIRPLGLFLMEDQGKPDHKVLGVPVGEPLWAHLRRLEDVPPHLLREMQHFFSVYKELEEKKTAAIGWRGLDETRTVIAAARARARAQEKQP